MRTKTLVSAAVVILSLAAMLASCGGGGGEGSNGPQLKQDSGVARFAFTVNAGDDTISILVSDPQTRRLRHNGSAPTGSAPAAVAVTPSDRYVYVANFGSDNISCFSLNAVTGALSLIATIPTNPKPTNIAVHPSGKFVYVASVVDLSAANPVIGVYRINETTGMLTNVDNETYSVVHYPRMVFDPQGRFLYLIGDSWVVGYSINAASGVLTSLTQKALYAKGPGMTDFAIHPSGKAAYVIHGGIAAYLYDPATGTIGAVPEESRSVGFGESIKVVVHPSGRWLFTCGERELRALAVNADSGMNLTYLESHAGNYCTTAGSVPSLDPSGQLLVAPSGSGLYVIYEIDQESGLLSRLASVRPRSRDYSHAFFLQQSVAFSHDLSPVSYESTFAYATDRAGDGVSGYAFNGITGVLEALGPVAVSNQPQSLTITADSRFLYVANTGGNSLSAYSIDSDIGYVTFVQNLATVGTAPKELAADPSGRFLYTVATRSSQSALVTYRIDTVSGKLTEVGAVSNSSLGSFPVQVSHCRVDPAGQWAVGLDTASGGASLGLVNCQLDGSSGTVTACTGEYRAVFTGGSVSALLLDPLGRFRYVANETKGEIAGFSFSSGWTPIDADRTTAGVQHFRAGSAPRAMAAEPLGRFLYVANAGSNDISAFTIDDATGSLNPIDADAEVAGSQNFGAGMTPTAISVDASGSFVFVTHAGSGDIWVYALESNGALRQVGTAATEGDPAAFAIGAIMH